MHYGLIKLLSGDEIIALIEEHEQHVVVDKPVQIVRVMGQLGPTIGVTEWLVFSLQQTVSINRDKIVAISVGLEDNALQQYLEYLDRDKQRIYEKYNEEEVDDMAEEIEAMLSQAANTTVH